jgi:Domain of unknown function (DUF4124)
MKRFSLLLILLSPICSADIYQWTDSNGSINYSDIKPDTDNVKTIKLKEEIFINSVPATKAGESRIISWEVTEQNASYITLAVKYFYDGQYNASQTWLSAYTLDNGIRSMNYSVRPSKMETGEGIINIRLGVSRRAPKRHCTNKIKFSMYGKDIPSFHEATVNFNKCWTNNYIKPTISNPTKGIK